MNMQREIDELNAVPLPPGFVARAATIADAETVTAVLNAAAVAVDGVEQFSVTECLQEWQTPGFNVATSSCLVWHEADQQPAGYIEVWDNRDPPTRIELFGATHPDYWARGVGSFLLAWGEARAHRAVARVPDGVQVTALCAVNGEHELSKALMEGSGLTLSRAAYRMVIDLHSDMVGPKNTAVPPGYELTTLKQFGDLRAVYRAYDESFRDHWGHVDRPEEVGFREFAHHIEEPDFDPELWLLLVEEETNEITAVGLCSPKSEENPTIGHVDILGVRRPWRRQGQGLLLLHQIFALFQQKGTYKQVALNVDAQSLTGATRLYERAGMRIERTYLIYEKVLQHGRDLSVTAVPEIKTGETS